VAEHPGTALLWITHDGEGRVAEGSRYRG